MTRYVSVCVVSLVGFSLCPAGASARLLEKWPYERLFKDTDLVVIATAVSTEKSGDSFTDDRWPLEFIGLNTTFEANHVLKGKLPGKSIKVLHYKFGAPWKKGGKVPDIIEIIDGPLFVGFRTNKPAKAFGPPTPQYMLFLKRRKDGRFEPVSGKIDPQLSVRELVLPSEELGVSEKNE
jgi:hypothetical protein